ncbi:unnamed protein product [Rodentolepis nana]|uniref:Uncharacterized protein n=1 Tax=Rodentolepis nana TaxID=102285 RepID=A0A0R3T6X2_RODNA|nr:unnamed protein product [Rodentolepis nana]
MNLILPFNHQKHTRRAIVALTPPAYSLLPLLLLLLVFPLVFYFSTLFVLSSTPSYFSHSLPAGSTSVFSIAPFPSNSSSTSIGQTFLTRFDLLMLGGTGQFSSIPTVNLGNSLVHAALFVP